MDNDRIFAAYALLLLAGVASVITASVMAGIAALPSAGVFLEHVALSFGFRAAYKSLGGFEWAHDAAAFVGWITTPEETHEIPHTGAQAAA
ncbi:MAG: hypothetical protein ACQGVC_06910 [Myxococcota bacterium]